MSKLLAAMTFVMACINSSNLNEMVWVISDFQVHDMNAVGLKCPEPIMLLHGVVRDARSGDHIIVRATDPSTERDINKFCTFLGHELRSVEQEGEVWVFTLVKGWYHLLVLDCYCSL